jgi:hypothetical protein
MNADGSFRRPLGPGENLDNLPKYLVYAGIDPYNGEKLVDLSQLAKMKMRLQSTIVEDGNMANFETRLRGLDFGRPLEDEAVREIFEMEIPGQPTIVQSIYALPENEFKNQLIERFIERLNIPPVVEPKGGKKRRSKLRSKKISSMSKKISSMSKKSRKTRSRKLRTRSRRRYRK